MAETTHCYRHPKRETRVSCATCGRPICTECMRQTAVGIKCPDDARLPRGARAGAMKGKQILYTVLAGLGVALLGIPAVYAVFEIGFFSIILSGLAGYGAGTLIFRAGGRNGGPLSIATAVVAVTVPFLFRLLPGILAGSIGFSVLAMIFAAIAAGFAGRGGS